MTGKAKPKTKKELEDERLMNALERAAIAYNNTVGAGFLSLDQQKVSNLRKHAKITMRITFEREMDKEL